MKGFANPKACKHTLAVERGTVKSIFSTDERLGFLHLFFSPLKPLRKITTIGKRIVLTSSASPLSSQRQRGGRVVCMCVWRGDWWGGRQLRKGEGPKYSRRGDKRGHKITQDTQWWHHPALRPQKEQGTVGMSCRDRRSEATPPENSSSSHGPVIRPVPRDGQQVSGKLGFVSRAPGTQSQEQQLWSQIHCDTESGSET